MTGKLRLLDGYCCAGGAGRGYQRAGFHVTGCDIKPQRRYAGDVFEERSFLSYTPEELRERFDAIHASPPCQTHSALKTMPTAKVHLDLIAPTRALLKASRLPWIMENVIGAPMVDPVILCGTMFALGAGDAELRRHRQFETSFPILFVPQCQHGGRVIGIYGGHARNRQRVIGVYGHGAQNANKHRGRPDAGMPDFTADQAREAMGIDWMVGAELSQAIPPAYTEWLGREMLAHIAAKREAA